MSNNDYPLKFNVTTVFEVSNSGCSSEFWLAKFLCGLWVIGYRLFFDVSDIDCSLSYWISTVLWVIGYRLFFELSDIDCSLMCRRFCKFFPSRIFRRSKPHVASSLDHLENRIFPETITVQTMLLIAGIFGNFDFVWKFCLLSLQEIRLLKLRKKHILFRNECECKR